MSTSEAPELGVVPEDYKLHERLGFRLSRLSRMVQGGLESGLARYGLTRLKWCVLSSVEIEGYSAPSEIADHIGVTRPAISRLLNAMIKDGLIERSLSEKDGRLRNIAITKQGRDRLVSCWPMVESNQERFLKKLSPEERDVLDAALGKMIAGETETFDDL